ncbi:hypothetical protein ALUC_20467S [Aspergillus luchuensis]|nr:hypothetical protein ALUC_20467S [Aspergillus luchuensis]
MATKTRHREWIPPALRPPTLVSLAVLSFGMIAALEALHHVSATWVLSPQNGTVLNLVRYLPTFGAIAFGFVFKGIVSDLKKATPWANMSKKWAKGEDSILLDYTNELEIVAVFSALRRKHWPVAIGLLGAFICGALVPLTNSLVYVDWSVPRNTTEIFTQISSFNFENHPLAMANGSLNIPWNSTGEAPYARAISQQLGDVPRATWTTGHYAFDQFTFSSTLNATLTAEVNAVSATMSCQPLRYTRVADSWAADTDDLKAAGCTGSLTFSWYMTSQAWLNITQCSDHGDRDVRILVNYNDYNSSSYNGSICSPKFTSQRMSLSVNSTNSEIMAFAPISDVEPLDVKTSTEALWIYLQNPLDPGTMERFGEGLTRGFYYDLTTRPVANMSNITSAVGVTREGGGVDYFMQVIVRGQPQGTAFDFSLVEAKAVDLAGKIWAEVISILARTRTLKRISGSVNVIDQKILVRTPVLRTLQALLALVGVLAFVFTLGLRPRTVLKRDPGPLAAAGLILSVSKTSTEQEMTNQVRLSAESMAAGLRNAQFTLQQRNIDEDYGVIMQHVHPSDQVEMTALDSRSLTRAAYQPAPKNQDFSPATELGNVSKGWRPASLRFTFKISLLIAAVAVMVGLGVMLWVSNRTNGVCIDTRVSSAALTLSASTILVLFGYCFAGVDSAAQTLAPFNVLRKRPNTRSIFIDDLSFLGRLSGLGSGRIHITLLASAANILTIPAMKLVAAGLFSPLNTVAVESVSIQLDISMTTALDKVSNFWGSDSIIKAASESAEWESTPNYGLHPSSGIIDNLVLDNMTAVAGERNNMSDGMVEARVSAFAVDIECEQTGPADFNISISATDNGFLWFTWSCSTEHCSKSFDSNSFTNINVGVAAGSEITSYIGIVSQDSREYETDPEYVILLADYSSFQNVTPISTTTPVTSATADSLNVTLPTLRAVSCTRNVSVVNVTASFARPTQASIGGGVQLLPWRPVSVKPESVIYERPYPTEDLYYFQPPKVTYRRYASGKYRDGTLSGNSLWPTHASSRNFFELLATDAQYRVGNLSRLLDVEGLADSASYMYRAYVTQVITQLRAYAANPATAPPANQTLPATFIYQQPRVRQNAANTYALEALLAVQACLALLVFYHFPSQAILPNAPGSIAARFSLLANSRIVRRLRQERVTDMQEVKKWREPAALGWWRDDSSEGANSTWRWGVDIGRDDSASSAPVLPEINFGRAAEGETLAVEDSDSRRDSVSSMDTLLERYSDHRAEERAHI